jgi:hypothetical protein
VRLYARDNAKAFADAAVRDHQAKPDREEAEAAQRDRDASELFENPDGYVAQKVDERLVRRRTMPGSRGRPQAAASATARSISRIGTADLLL